MAFLKRKTASGKDVYVEEVPLKQGVSPTSMTREDFEEWYQRELRAKAVEKKVIKKYGAKAGRRFLRRPTGFQLTGQRVSGMSGAISDVRHKLGLFQGAGDQGRGAQLSRFMVGDMGGSQRPPNEILLGGGGTDSESGVDYGWVYQQELARQMGKEKRKQIRDAARAQARHRLREHRLTAQDILIGEDQRFEGLGPNEIQIYRDTVTRQPRRKKHDPNVYQEGTMISPPSLSDFSRHKLLGGVPPGPRRARRHIRFV
jgi:hypothetical protein